MYRDRGVVGSKSEIGPLDRKRTNDALDKHLEKSSPSTSRSGLNGKEKDRLYVPSTSSGKPPPDHRDNRSASLSKNKHSDVFGFKRTKEGFGPFGETKNLYISTQNGDGRRNEIQRRRSLPSRVDISAKPLNYSLKRSPIGTNHNHVSYQALPRDDRRCCSCRPRETDLTHKDTYIAARSMLTLR